MLTSEGASPSVLKAEAEGWSVLKACEAGVLSTLASASVLTLRDASRGEDGAVLLQRRYGRQ